MHHVGSTFGAILHLHVKQV